MTLFSRLLASCLCAVLILISAGAEARESFSGWLSAFKTEAAGRGISTDTLNRAFSGVSPIERIIELDRKQPERKIGFDEYQAKALTQARIAEGRRLYTENHPLLREIGMRFGVQPQYVVALWGMETSYGRNTGGFDIVAALATLAWEGRRGPYFRGELLEALSILQGGHVSRQDFKGSWAGAMGQVQFMPSSWRRFAVDYNGDGHRDIWTSRPDALASGANYLSKSGWRSGQRWGREVRLPPGFPAELIGKTVVKSLSEWADRGIRNSDGSSLPIEDSIRAFVLKPEGANGKAYLGYENLAVVMKWNNSSYFAITVGQLADKIAPTMPSYTPVAAPAQVPKQNVVQPAAPQKMHYNE